MILAIDIGGTSSKFGVVDPVNRSVSGYERFSTPEAVKTAGLDYFLEEKIAYFLQKHPGITGIGMGLPGLLSKDRKTILELPNIPGVRRLPLIDRLAGKFPGISLKMENDAKCATLGEHRMGACQGVSNFLLVTLGTGVGSGVIINGGLFTGARGNGLELGHILVGGDQTLEEQIGLNGFLAYARARLSSQPQGTQLAAEGLDGKMIYDAAKQGDRFAASLFTYLGKLLGNGLVAAVRLLDVTHLLIGGGLSGAFEFIHPAVRATMEDRLPAYYTDALRIEKASLGNDAGLLGAASLLIPAT